MLKKYFRICKIDKIKLLFLPKLKSKIMGHEKTVKKEEKKKATKTPKEKKEAKRAKKAGAQ